MMKRALTPAVNLDPARTREGIKSKIKIRITIKNTEPHD
jgi:hypothetical protein